MGMKEKNKNTGTVYSTDFGKMCPQCDKAIDQCTCKLKKRELDSDGVVRVKRETKGRKGKGVTLITGLPLDEDQLKSLTRSFKQKSGSGGSLKNGVIEIQGDHREVLEKELIKLGYKVQRSGG
ncbi:MAG: translation initiation factor Sui1 [Nitrospinota bacterium]